MKSNRNIVYICRYHIVFCPKYRRKVLLPPIDSRLKTLIIEIVESLHGGIIEIEVMADHVHILLECDPQFGIHRMVKRIKGASSKILRDEFPELKRRLPSLWTNAYFCATVGAVSLETVKKYIESQKGA
jgi:putative transposase